MPNAAHDDTEVESTVARLRSAFDSGRTASFAWRRAQLLALRRMLVEGGSQLEAALHADLGKHPTESQLLEIGFVITEIDNTLSHLRSWLRPHAVAVPPALQPARASTMLEPVGVALIIAPWNYPVQLLLSPAVGAIAAGNAVLLKPSELAPQTAHTLAALVEQYLDPAIGLIEGDADTTTTILAQRFDHIFFTGSTTVGRIVMRAAAEQLTPVTLELGGKCPVWVDESTDIEAAALRIAWGKLINAGQTCVAPDYVLATAATAARLVPALRRAIEQLYGGDIRTNPDYGRIINDTQFERLLGLLPDRAAAGPNADAAARYLAPTVIDGVDRDDPLMQQEIFGPILPVVHVRDLDEAIAVIRHGERPLALYAFTESGDARRALLERTSSGAVGFGIPAAHLVVPGLPFGGVGASGFGAYHGRRSVATFSHEKAILSKRLVPDTMKLVYPPYTGAKSRFVRGLLRKLG